MKLKHNPFHKIKDGNKDIEMRLYDEKRQKIQFGDTIEFTNIMSGETIKYIVKKIHIYDSFDKLYQMFDKERLGYQKHEKAQSYDMEKYYTKEEINKYKVIGIELIKNRKKE